MPPKALGEGGAMGVGGASGSGVVPAIFPEGHRRQDALMLSSGGTASPCKHAEHQPECPESPEGVSGKGHPSLSRRAGKRER